MNYFELKFLNKDMTVLVPTHCINAMPIRPLSSRENVHDAMRVLAQPARKLGSYEFTASSWNKRHKEYQTKLRAGGLRELSEIYRDLRFIEMQKELSFGEKNLLCQIEQLLAEEISLVEHLEREAAIMQLRSLCWLSKEWRLYNARSVLVEYICCLRMNDVICPVLKCGALLMRKFF